jgi:hypothetical protein
LLSQLAGVLTWLDPLQKKHNVYNGRFHLKGFSTIAYNIFLTQVAANADNGEDATAAGQPKQQH